MPNSVPQRVIGRGRTADVLEHTDTTVVKVFHAWRAPEHIDAEERVATVVAGLEHVGYRVPAVHGRILTADDRVGIVFDTVDGEEMLGALGSTPWRIASFARCLATVHAAVNADRHAADLSALPRFVDRVERQISEAGSLLGDLAEPVRRRFDLLVDLEETDVLCHGDYHPGNLLMGDTDPAVIDWTNATRGPVGMDVAMTTVLLRCAVVPGTGITRRVMVTGRSVFHMLYRRASRRIRPSDVAAADAWLPVMAAGRLMDSPVDEHPALLRIVRSALA